VPAHPSRTVRYKPLLRQLRPFRYPRATPSPPMYNSPSPDRNHLSMDVQDVNLRVRIGPPMITRARRQQTRNSRRHDQIVVSSAHIDSTRTRLWPAIPSTDTCSNARTARRFKSTGRAIPIQQQLPCRPAVAAYESLGRLQFRITGVDPKCLLETPKSTRPLTREIDLESRNVERYCRYAAAAVAVIPDFVGIDRKEIQEPSMSTITPWASREPDV